MLALPPLASFPSQSTLTVSHGKHGLLLLFPAFARLSKNALSSVLDFVLLAPFDHVPKCPIGPDIGHGMPVTLAQSTAPSGTPCKRCLSDRTISSSGRSISKRASASSQCCTTFIDFYSDQPYQHPPHANNSLGSGSGIRSTLAL